MNLPAYEERAQLVAVEIAERYYPAIAIAIAIAIAEAEGPRGDERVAGEARRRKRPECGGGSGKEGEVVRKKRMERRRGGRKRLLRWPGVMVLRRAGPS